MRTGNHFFKVKLKHRKKGQRKRRKREKRKKEQKKKRREINMPHMWPKKEYEDKKREEERTGHSRKRTPKYDKNLGP